VERFRDADSSFTATQEALRGASYHAEADLLARVSESSERREDYARETFQALAQVIPARKLRWLQYVNKDTAGWWRPYEDQGAILLGKAAEKAAFTQTPVVLA